MSNQIIFSNLIMYSPLLFFTLGALIIYTYFISLNFVSNDRIYFFKEAVSFTACLIFFTIFIYAVNINYGFYQNYNTINFFSMKLGSNFIAILFLILCFILFYIWDIIYDKKNAEWETVFLLWFFIFGNLLLLHCSHLFVFVLSLEIVSHSILALIVLTRKKKNVESSLKMFIVNAMLSVPLLLAISYVNIYMPENIYLYNSFVSDNFFSLSENYNLLLSDNSINDFLQKKQILFILLISTFVSKLGIFPFTNWWINIYKGINIRVLIPMLFLNKFGIIISLIKIKLSYGLFFSELWWIFFLFFGVLTSIIGSVWFLSQNTFLKNKILSLYLINIGISALFLSMFESSIYFYVLFILYLWLETFFFIFQLILLVSFKNNKLDLTNNIEYSKKLFQDISLYDNFKYLYKIKPNLITLFGFFIFNIISFPGSPLFFIKYFLLTNGVTSQIFYHDIHIDYIIFSIFFVVIFSVILYFILAQTLKRYNFVSEKNYINIINLQKYNIKYLYLMGFALIVFFFMTFTFFFFYNLFLNLPLNVLLTII